MAKTPEKPRRRPGRPSKSEEVRRALAELGVDPSLISPKRILAAIAADADAPASARVNAAKALLGQEPAEAKQPDKDKAEARLPQRVRAQRAAASVGGGEWGDDLVWPSDGRRPQ
jgi:hypothetical protein